VPEKYEREIDEILRKMSFKSQPRREQRSAPNWSAGWQNLTADISPGRLYLLGLALLLLGFFARASFPGLAAPLSLLGVLALGVGYAIAVTSRSARRPRSWRGRNLEPSGNELWSGLWRRWQRWWDERGWTDRR
jgi:hypothetical protein